MTIEQLIHQCRKGKSAAQEELFKLLHNRMMHICRRYMKNIEDAEDCFSNGLARMFNGFETYQFISDPAFYAWISRIMINECLRYLATQHSFIMVQEKEADEVCQNDDVLGKLAADEIIKMLVRLPVGYRTILNLFAIEGLEHKEIALLLGISEGTSKSQLSRARSAFQKILKLNEPDYGKQQSK